MSFMDGFECSFTFLVWYHYPGSLQDNTIFNGQLFSESPIGLYLAWHLSDLLGHPCVMVCLRISWVAILISFKLSLLVFSWFVIWCICSLGSLIVSFCPPSLEKQSCKWYVSPGLYLTVKWYANLLRNIVCNLGVAWLRHLDNMASSRFWSVSSWKWLTYRKWWNFSITQAPVRDSSSITK